MTKEEARADLMLAQADISYRPKDDSIDTAIEALENQKTGHWVRWYEEVEHKTCTENIPHCKCSECNKEYDTYASFFIKYCSQCGAKMWENS